MPQLPCLFQGSKDFNETVCGSSWIGCLTSGKIERHDAVTFRQWMWTGALLKRPSSKTLQSASTIVENKCGSKRREPPHSSLVFFQLP